MGSDDDRRLAEMAAIAAGKYYEPEHGGVRFPNADFVAGYLAACEAKRQEELLTFSVITNPRKTSKEIDRQIVAAYQSGLTLKQVGERFGLGLSAVRSRLYEAGLRGRSNKEIAKAKREKK